MPFGYLAAPWIDIKKRQSSHGDSVPALHGIRGLAVLIVLASHTNAFGMTGQGSVGVFLFFTLSGFVLALPFAERPETIFQARELWRYFANRFLRIVPAFTVAVLVIALQTGKGLDWALLNLSFYGGWNHLWSVAEEARFYFLFPFALGLLALMPSRTFRIAALALLIPIAWKFRGIHLIDMMMADGEFREFYFYFFLTGMLSCMIYRSFEPSTLGDGYAVDAIGFVTVVALGSLNGWQHPELWCAIFLFLLVGLSISERALTARLLRSWIMQHIGMLSYSLYLFHVPVMLWLVPLQLQGISLFAMTFIATYAVAVASYLVVEKPFLMLKPGRLQVHASRPDTPSSRLQRRRSSASAD
jgi:peptidoglycan/LPS O-acetylase OafA/YrhL